MKKHILLVSFALFLGTCSSDAQAEAIAEVETEVATPEETPKEEVVSHENFEHYFADFQKAVKENDIEKVRAMSVEENLGTKHDKFFDDKYNFVFQEEIKHNFSVLSAKDAYSHGDMTAGYDDIMYNDVQELCAYPDGTAPNEEGSNYCFYFGKENGIYKLIMVVAAG